MSRVQFIVAGIPAPQGSKTPYGTEANPRTKPWRAAVAAEAALAMGDKEPLAGPISLTVGFWFPRPKSHYRTGKRDAELRDTAPLWHSGRPDTDKLLRAIGDALTGIVVRDDSQLARINAFKAYGAAEAVVIVRELTENDFR